MLAAYIRTWYITRTYRVEATKWLPPTARQIGEKKREREEKRRKEVERKHNRIVNIVFFFWMAELNLCIYTGVCLLNFLLPASETAFYFFLLFLNRLFYLILLFRENLTKRNLIFKKTMYIYSSDLLCLFIFCLFLQVLIC